MGGRSPSCGGTARPFQVKPAILTLGFRDPKWTAMAAAPGAYPVDGLCRAVVVRTKLFYFDTSCFLQTPVLLPCLSTILNGHSEN